MKFFVCIKMSSGTSEEKKETVEEKIARFTKIRDENLEMFAQTREISYECIANTYQEMIDIYDKQVTQDEKAATVIEGSMEFAPKENYKDVIDASKPKEEGESA